jgi:hypothetical protein
MSVKLIQFRTLQENQFSQIINLMRKSWKEENRYNAWFCIYTFYVTYPWLSYRMISSCLGIPLSTIAYRAKRDKWQVSRLSIKDRVIQKVYGKHLRASRAKKKIHNGKLVYVSQYETDRFRKQISKDRRIIYKLERTKVKNEK